MPMDVQQESAGHTFPLGPFTRSLTQRKHTVLCLCIAHPPKQSQLKQKQHLKTDGIRVSVLIQKNHCNSVRVYNNNNITTTTMAFVWMSECARAPHLYCYAMRYVPIGVSSCVCACELVRLLRVKSHPLPPPQPILKCSPHGGFFRMNRGYL